MNKVVVWIGAALVWLLASTTTQAGTRHYYYTDPQGTVLAKADAAGNIIETSDYRPYGARALGTSSNGTGYTGHINDADSGLIYMQARYYDPEVGRFLSIDPHPASDGEIFFNNRYVYANNSPVRYSDTFGDKPGDRFATPELAAYDALSFINSTSIATNHEFQGWIAVDGNQFYATNPVVMSETGGPGEPPPAKVVGGYHTHGNYSIEIAPGKFIVTGDPARDNLGSDKFSTYDVRRYQAFQKMLGGVPRISWNS
jgi:RHS repeat-associated protein